MSIRPDRLTANRSTESFGRRDDLSFFKQEASMLDTVMLMSEVEIRDIRTARKARAIRNDRVERMTLARAGTVCLAAFMMAVVWAPIIYFGSMLFGGAMELATLG